MTKRG